MIQLYSYCIIYESNLGTGRAFVLKTSIDLTTEVGIREMETKFFSEVKGLKRMFISNWWCITPKDK